MTHRAAAAAALLVALLAACGGSATHVNAASVVGRTFLSESATDGGAPRPLVGSTRIRLAFTADNLTAWAGCNTLSGHVQVTGTRLVVGDLASTAIGCDPALQDQDTWLARILSADPSYTLDGDHLELVSGTTTIRLLDRRVADPDRPLQGTMWQVDGIADGATSSSAPAGVTATVRFASGRVAVDVAGCAHGEGDVTIAGAELRFGPLTMAGGTCPSGAATVKSAVEAVLAGTVSYRIEAAALTVTNPSGKGLMLRAAG